MTRPSTLFTALASYLPEIQIISPESPEVQAYVTDVLGRTTKGCVGIVLPRDAGETSRLLKFCRSHGLAVVPQGGNTGLVQGTVMPDGKAHVILSTRRMSCIAKTDELAGTVECGAGVVLAALNATLEPSGLYLPISLGSEGSAQIGSRAG